jgi:hypothetical protein
VVVVVAVAVEQNKKTAGANEFLFYGSSYSAREAKEKGHKMDGNNAQEAIEWFIHRLTRGQHSFLSVCRRHSRVLS